MMAEATDDATNDAPSHVRDATRSASDVGCIMRILRILFALDGGGSGRSCPPSLWGLRCALCAALPCHDLHHKCNHALPRDFVPGSIFASAFCFPFSLNSRCNLLLRPAI